MKTAELCFDFTIETECPHCHAKLDLEENDFEDDSYFTRKFIKWICNEKDADKIDEVQTCFECEKEFKLNKIVR